MQTPAEEGPGDQPQPPVIASEDDIFDGELVLPLDSQLDKKRDRFACAIFHLCFERSVLTL